MIEFVVAEYVNTTLTDHLVFILKFDREIIKLDENICLARYDINNSHELFINPYKYISSKKETEIYKYIHHHFSEFEVTYSNYLLSTHIKILLKFPLDLNKLRFSKMSWEYLINNNYNNNKLKIIELRKKLIKLGIRV